MDNQPATKKDIDKIERTITDLTAVIQTSFEGVHAEISSVRSELKNDIASVRSELKNDIMSVNNKLNDIKTEVLESNEHIAKEVSDMRAEQAAIAGGKDRLDDMLLAHGDTLKNTMAACGC